jgi:hypothetical protein
MDDKNTFSEHVDVMVAKAFAILGFIRRLSLEFRDPYTLKSLYTSLVRPKLEVACGIRSMMFVLTEWNACKGALFDMLCVGQTCMICHHMRTDAPFCILTPPPPGEKAIDCLCYVYFRCSEWESELTKLVVRSHHDIRLAIPSFCVLISVERTMEFMNQFRVRCDTLMRSLVCLISV